MPLPTCLSLLFLFIWGTRDSSYIRVNRGVLIGYRAGAITLPSIKELIAPLPRCPTLLKEVETPFSFITSYKIESILS